MARKDLNPAKIEVGLKIEMFKAKVVAARGVSSVWKLGMKKWEVGRVRVCA